MGSGRVGAVLGVGAIAGVAFVFLRARTASAAAAGSPYEHVFEPTPVARGPFPPLVERWRHEIQKRAVDLPVNALLEWLRIESGGDMCSVGNPTEVGIWQLSFPSDTKYGATLAGLRALCEKSKLPGFNISWLSEAELDMEVGSGIRKILAARDTVRRTLAQTGAKWPEASFDFGSAVKQIHATPAVITELLPKIARRDGHAPTSWADLRQSVRTFPVAQMGEGARALALAKSKHGLPNRLDDTMYNAEFVGRAWAAAPDRGTYV